MARARDVLAEAHELEQLGGPRGLGTRDRRLGEPTQPELGVHRRDVLEHGEAVEEPRQLVGAADARRTRAACGPGR